MHRELQRSLNPFLLVWNPSFYSLISYGCFQSHLQFRDIVPMPLSLKWSPYIEWFKTKTLGFDNRNDTILGQPNWQKIVWTCWSTLFVEGPTLTVDHALTLDHATVDLSIRLHSLGGEVVQFQLCAARWHLVSITHLLIGVRDLPSVLVKYGSSFPIILISTYHPPGAYFTTNLWISRPSSISSIRKPLGLLSRNLFGNTIMKGSLEQLRPSQASFIGKAHKGWTTLYFEWISSETEK